MPEVDPFRLGGTHLLSIFHNLVTNRTKGREKRLQVIQKNSDDTA